MKKTLLSLGSLFIVAAPVAAVVSCGSGGDNNDHERNMPGFGITYTPKHNVSEYPSITRSTYNELETYGWDFYQLKGADYFTGNPDIKYPSDWNDNFLEYGYSNNSIVISINYYELYDFAHEQDFISHGIKSDGSNAAPGFNNSFPYLKN